MEIKDINVSVERAEEVRGGFGFGSPSITQLGIQYGGNIAVGSAESKGVGNSTSNQTIQHADQEMLNLAHLDSKNLFRVEKSVTNSVLGFGW
ncbi:MAG TPA: hypothetical protein VF210_18535 [Pseudomonadales bacterium]